MTKTPTVADAMRAMSTQYAVTKAEPVDVKIVNDKLTPAEAGRFLVTLFLSWPLRALVVWGFLAIFLPTLGATYIAVLLGLWAVSVILPPKGEALAKSIIAQRK